MSRAAAFAKINLALVVGPLRSDGKHEVATALQAVDLHDDIELEQADGLTIEGFSEDTIVRASLEAFAKAAAVAPGWRVRIVKRIPAAAGLGGGSTDAAAALRLANQLHSEPLSAEELQQVAAGIGADVPFFLRDGPQLARGDGSELSPLDLPDDYAVLLALPAEERKDSTASVYRRFDERGGADGFEQRRAELLESLAQVERPTDLARLPRNNLASSPLAEELERLGAFRADVTGAGPAVYGLFERRVEAERAASSLEGAPRSWVVDPVPHR